MGDEQIFLKSRRDVPLMKIYGMSLIWAGSILLDNTFKHEVVEEDIKLGAVLFHII
jgi:hypothetical protein